MESRPATTKARRLLEMQLSSAGHEDLTQIVNEKRGDGCSWFAIALHIRDLTGESISDQTLRLWFKDEVAA